MRAGFGEKIKDPIEAIARGAAAGAIGQWAAGKIGAAYADPKNPIDPVSHKMYHAALGAATGSLMGGRGCAVSGAVGALVAKLSADIMKPAKPLEHMKQKESELGRKLNRAEFNALYPSVHKTYIDNVSNTGKISKIVAGISPAFAGGNVAVGAATGANAIDNNFAFVAGFGVSALADAAFAASLVDGLALAGGVYLVANEALDFIGVKVVEGGYSYQNRVYGSVNDVLAAVMIDNPVTQAAGSIYLVAKTLLDVVLDNPNILTTPIQEGKPSIVSTPAVEPEPTVIATPANDEAGKYNVETFPVGELPELDPEGFGAYDGPQISHVIEKKIHVVYGNPGPGEEADYIGRTRGEVPDEGYTPKDVKRILEKRDRNHHMNERGFGDARLRHVSENPAAVRGLEQQEIERQGGAQSQGGTSSNAINGIAAKNPKRDAYLDAAKQEFGE